MHSQYPYAWYGLVLATLCTFTSGSSNVLAADADFSNGTVTSFIPFSNATTNPNFQYVPNLDFTIGNYTSHAPMDTGSTGILMAAKHVPGFPPDNCTYGSEYLSSSKRLYEGCWINSTFKFSSIAVAEVPVLAVSSLCICSQFSSETNKCTVPTTNCTSNSGVQYIGVGFGRERAGQTEGDTDKNPFINIISVNGSDVKPGTMHTGYTITAAGVHLGLTSSNTVDFFTTQLDPGPYHSQDPHDWASIPACISVDGAPCVLGTSLFDTGFDNSYLRSDTPLHNIYCLCLDMTSTPAPPCPDNCTRQLLPGHTVQVFIGSAPNYTAYYNLLGGEIGNPMSPCAISPQAPQPGNGAYINTGRLFYRGFEALFDAEGGWYGLRSRLPLGTTFGGVYRHAYKSER
ncbi:hypothetical protein MMC13_002002 [Lambiella insularis]|nr:hypothetical protein [Lambiella insularis]